MMHRPWKRSPRRLDETALRLTFAPLAWLKLQFFCHSGETEIGGFGISAEDNLLYVQDFVTVRQQVSWDTVRFDDEAVAVFFDSCVDQGLSPDRFARLWCHTHPGASVKPSATDEETFARSFGRCDWAVMFILGRTGRTYARLAFTAGPGVQLEVPVAVDWSAWAGSLSKQPGHLEAQVTQWQAEYAANVHCLPRLVEPFAGLPLLEPDSEEALWQRYGWCPELDLTTYELTEEEDGDALDPRPQAS
jgi:hypothetical protein